MSFTGIWHASNAIEWSYKGKINVYSIGGVLIKTTHSVFHYQFALTESVSFCIS